MAEQDAIQEASVVLDEKFRQAQAIVDCYEAKVTKLRAMTKEAILKQIEPAELRKTIEDFNRSISRSSIAKSLIADDHARTVKKLGKRFQKQLDRTFDCWQRCSTELSDADDDPLEADEERFLLGKFALATCEVFELGIRPVRQLRDHYISSLKPSAKPRTKRGRPKDEGKPARDANIYNEFHRRSGSKGNRRDALGRGHGLKPNTIAKIVKEQEQKKGK